MTDAVVGLGAAIEALRLELAGAMLSGHGEGIQFEMDPMELTVETVLTNEGNGKVGWKILELGASRKSAVTQTLTLKLKPVYKRPDGTKAPDFTIASAAPAGDSVGPRE